jgi:3-isopropylmalate dehydratase small subunit
MTRPFPELRGLAAALPVANIDTDQIIPKQFLKTVTRSGLGRGFLHDFRYAIDGSEIGDFILNSDPWRHAVILICGENFGCGSSREHAPWAMLDFGIRCVIAPSFAEIFYNNCLGNGLLPIALAGPVVVRLTEEAQEPAVFEVSLVNQTVLAPSGDLYHFEIEGSRRARLLSGMDPVDETLHHASSIDAFEVSRAAERRFL